MWCVASKKREREEAKYYYDHNDGMLSLLDFFKVLN